MEVPKRRGNRMKLQATEMAITDTLLKDTKDQPDQINTDYDRQGADLATATNTADSTMHSAAMPIGDADQSSAGLLMQHHRTGLS